MDTISKTGEKQKICVATDTQLRNEHYRRRLLLVLRNLRIPRRDWVEILTDLFQNLGLKNIQVMWPDDNALYEIPFVDDLIPDPDGRNIGYTLHPCKPWEVPRLPRRLELLRAMDLYVRKEWPKIAALIAK